MQENTEEAKLGLLGKSTKKKEQQSTNSEKLYELINKVGIDCIQSEEENERSEFDRETKKKYDNRKHENTRNVFRTEV